MVADVHRWAGVTARPGAAGAIAPTAPWWAVDGLADSPAGLTVDGHPLAELAGRHGTPLYVYSRARVRRQIGRLRAALATLGVPARAYYAVKANRHPDVLATVRAEGDVGLDCCSPREVELALASGFEPRELSVTASMLSNRDLDAFAARRVHLNLDSLSVLRRYATRVPPGTRIGLRVDPGLTGSGDAPAAGGESPGPGWYLGGKFGLAPEALEPALAIARESGLVVDTLHVHCGWCLQRQDERETAAAFAGLARLAARVPTLETLNVGGGLGVRHVETDQPLPLAAWANLLRAHVAPLGLPIACEPGTFLVAEAGLLVVEANTVEEKRGRTWLGVDAGHGVNLYPGLYDLPLQIVHVGRPFGQPEREYVVGGNINEAGDLFAERAALPTVAEGDLLALLPTGAYGAAMGSDHCLRGRVGEVAV